MIMGVPMAKQAKSKRSKADKLFSSPKVGSKEWFELMTDRHGKLTRMNGYDDCILGVVEKYTKQPFLLYDREKVIQKLAKEMSYEEAVEFHEYNQACLWAGEGTWGFIDLHPL